MSRKISVQSLADTEILKITVTDRDAKLAAHIANSLSEVFNREITRIYKISNVSVIDKANVPINPANSHLARDLVLAMFVSFVGVSAIIFVVFYFDDTLRSVDDMEAEIKSTSGDADLTGEAERIRMHSVSGDVTAELKNDGVRLIDARSTSGDVEIGLAKGTDSVHVNASTVSGTVSKYIPDCGAGAQLQINAGSVSGDVTIR